MKPARATVSEFWKNTCQRWAIFGRKPTRAGYVEKMPRFTRLTALVCEGLQEARMGRCSQFFLVPFFLATGYLLFRSNPQIHPNKHILPYIAELAARQHIAVKESKLLQVWDWDVVPGSDLLFSSHAFLHPARPLWWRADATGSWGQVDGCGGFRRAGDRRVLEQLVHRRLRAYQCPFRFSKVAPQRAFRHPKVLQ